MIGPAEIRNASILIVDDTSVNVLLLERMLAGAGFTSVSSTSKPAEVVALYKEHRYDLILLDLLMPKMDGFQVLEALKAVETEGYVPVIVLTAQPTHKTRALTAGARDFISKPFDHHEVLTRIQNVLEVRLLLREARSYSKLLEQFDLLTGLPNRRHFCDLLRKMLDREASPTEQVSVLIVSLDRFKIVNDVLGRANGGVLLSAVADRLVTCLGPMTTIARLEGGEFGVLLVTDDGDAHAAQPVAQRMREALRQPLTVDGHELAITASIGISVSPTDSVSADLLLTYAARALGEARSTGGDTCRFYSAETNARAQHALELETALRGALDRREFVLHYQPKMRVETGEWSSAEALIRWVRPDKGLVPPSEFISILEETGLIIQVGGWVIDSVCKQIAEWASAGLGDIRISVNVSSKQFTQAGFVANVANAIAVNAIPPSSLDIEITESSLMARTDETDTVLRELKALGVLIAIDDFGTGYSSLSYLKRYPIDTLKIDISFIRDLVSDPDGGAIAVAIINMARVLKMTVIAEGVETQPQLDFLRAHACDEIQGYFFSKPLPAADLATLRHNSRSARANGATPAAAAAVTS